MAQKLKEILEAQDDAETERILALSDKEVRAEHLALFNGNKKLAKRAIAMTRATLEAALAKSWKQ